MSTIPETVPFARTGDWVTRENGERICQVKNDLIDGHNSSVEDFDNWQITPPKPGDEIPPRAEDGTSYTRQHGVGVQIFIDGKWRP